MKNEILTVYHLHQGFMHLREIIINNVKREKRMADFLGHSNDLIILSLFLSQVPTYNSISFMYRPRGRVNIRLSLQLGSWGRFF